MSRLNVYLPVSGNLNTLVAGSTVNGGSLLVSDSVRVKLKNLSAQVSATAATATLTVSFKWQVSIDGTTFLDVANGPQNAASVVFTTGTSAIKSGVIQAPEAVYAWAYTRIVLVTGVATGAAGDLYTMSYTARTSQSLDG